MFRVHVGLDLENKTGETGFFRNDHSSVSQMRTRSWGERQKRVQEQLHAEIVHRTTEKDRSQFAGEYRGASEGGAGAIEHRQLFHRVGVGLRSHCLTHDWIG